MIVWHVSSYLIFINIKYLPKIEYGGSSLQYPIKYTPPIYEGLKPHSIRLQESILKESAFTFILSSSPWMSGAGCWDILMRCLFTWCLPSSRWRKRILSDSGTRKMCRRTWTCQWPEIQNYTKHVSDVRWGINSSYSHMECNHYIRRLLSFLWIQIQVWIWRFEVGNTIYNWQYLHW